MLAEFRPQSDRDKKGRPKFHKTNGNLPPGKLRMILRIAATHLNDSDNACGESIEVVDI